MQMLMMLGVGPRCLAADAHDAGVLRDYGLDVLQLMPKMLGHLPRRPPVDAHNAVVSGVGA